MIGEDNSPWERLKRILETRLVEVTERVADGAARDYPMYRQYVGERREIVWVLAEMKRITTGGAPKQEEAEEVEE